MSDSEQKVEAFLEAYNQANARGGTARMYATGTLSEFECFTRGFSDEMKERVRRNWEFTE